MVGASRGSGGPELTASDIPFPHATGATALLWIAGLALFLALLWFVPILYDIRQANKWRATRQAALIEEMVRGASKGRQGLTVEEVRQLVSAMDRPPRGTQGLTSSLLALLIVFLVGIALFANLLSRGDDSADLRKTIVTSLLAVLATISGFYFGARTAQTSTEQAIKPPESRSGPQTGGPEGPRGGSGEGAATTHDEASQGDQPPSGGLTSPTTESETTGADQAGEANESPLPPSQESDEEPGPSGPVTG
jgi:hypothetical protein